MTKGTLKVPSRQGRRDGPYQVSCQGPIAPLEARAAVMRRVTQATPSPTRHRRQKTRDTPREERPKAARRKRLHLDGRCVTLSGATPRTTLTTTHTKKLYCRHNSSGAIGAVTRKIIGKKLLRDSLNTGVNQVEWEGGGVVVAADVLGGDGGAWVCAAPHATQASLVIRNAPPPSPSCVPVRCKATSPMDSPCACLAVRPLLT